MNGFTHEQLTKIRAQFPALAVEVAGEPAAYFDGPAGTQVPQPVIDAMVHYLSKNSANHGGLFATAIASDAMLDAAHLACAEFVGASDPGEIIFGQNMTSLTFAISRAIARTWKPGDEIVVTRLDHDANVSPWVLAARDAGVTVRWIDVRDEDLTLDLSQLDAILSPRTRLVAVGAASNSTGGVNPIREITARAQRAGALVYIDAVHLSPHQLPDVQQIGCDFLACSAYKFFGPHTGILWGKRALLESLEAYKVRPSPTDLPGKWMTGTQSHESIAGVLACIEYLANLHAAVEGVSSGQQSRREKLAQSYARIAAHERSLAEQFLRGMRELSHYRVMGITDLARLEERVATFSLIHTTITPRQLAIELGERGLFAWHGNYYALNLSERLGREPAGMLRVGMVHYNTHHEVERLLAALRQIDR